MDIASGQVESLVENIRELEAHNRQISGIASIINEITDQLNLMALNAQIEAAGAGAYGRRFSVVAEEVKRLADNSRTSTASIQKIIKNVLGNVSALVDSAQLSLDATRRSLENMNAVGADLAAIDGEISRTHVLTREIKVSTHQQSTAQQELTQALAEVDSVTFSNAEKMTRQVEGAVTDLSDIAQYLTMTLETIIPKTPENENLDAITLEPGAGQSKNDGSD